MTKQMENDKTNDKRQNKWQTTESGQNKQHSYEPSYVTLA